MIRKEFTFDRFVRMAIGLAIFAGIIYLINYLSGVLLPFVIACVIAYMIYPIVKFFQYKLHFKYRGLSIITVLILIFAILTGIVLFVIPPIINEGIHIKDLLNTYITTSTSSSSIPDFLRQLIVDNINMNRLNDFLSKENIMQYSKALLPKVWNILAQSMNILFGIFTSFIILLYLFFILLDYEKLEKGWINIIPRRYRRFFSHLAEDLEEGMSGYFRGQSLVALCVGILFSIGFLIIDFPMAIGLGLFIGLLNLVPYLQIIGFIPTIILAALKAAETGQNFWWIFIAAMAVFAVVQTIQDFLLVPKIMGKITGLNPAIILLSLSIWGALMGIIGMIIALPMTTLILSYYKRFILGNESFADDSIGDLPADQEKK